MLSKIKARQEYIGLSLRSLSKELEVSPTLLSLVLNGKRKPSKPMRKKLLTCPPQTYPVERSDTGCIEERQKCQEKDIVRSRY